MSVREHREALELFDSHRGKFIIGQALHLAIKELEKTPEPFQEKSNITDMKLLQTIFFPYELVEQTRETLAKEMGNG